MGREQAGLSRRELENKVAIISAAYLILFCWCLYAKQSDLHDWQLAILIGGATSTLVALILNGAGRGRKMPSMVVALFFLHAFNTGYIATAFSCVAANLASQADRWLYDSYMPYYVAAFLLSFGRGVQYFRKSPEGDYAATLRRRLSADDSGLVIRPPKQKSSGAANLIIFGGFLLQAVSSVCLGRLSGLLYSSFLISIPVGPFCMAFALVNALNDLGGRRQ